jgi:hypothetical protein
LHIIDQCAGPSLFVTAYYQPIKIIKRLVRKASSLYLPTKKREFSQRKKTKEREKMGKQVNDLICLDPPIGKNDIGCV